MSERYLMDCWPGENHLEDIITWGIQPLMTLNDVFDRYVFDENPELVFLHYEYKSKLQNLEKIIFRYDLYHMLVESRLKELCSDDPLVVDPVGCVKAELQFREERMAAIEANRQEKNEKFKQLCKIAEKNNLTADVCNELLDVIIQKAEKMEQKNNLIKKISAFTDEEAEQLFDVVLAFHNRSEGEQKTPKAENQTIGA